MAIKTKKSEERPPVPTTFYTGKIVNTPELETTQYGFALNLTWKANDSSKIPFEITKKVFFDDEKTWILDRLFQNAKCTPISVQQVGDDTVNEWEEADLEGKEIDALVYQEQYTNIFDFIATDAEEDKRTQLMKRFQSVQKNGNGNGKNKKLATGESEVDF